jgi:hypothetical protein
MIIIDANWKRLATAAGLLAVLSLGPGAFANQPANPTVAPTDPEPSVETIEVSDEKLQQFLSAAISVQDVQREYVAEIQATEDAARAETLREEAQDVMVTAVEEAGLTVLEFNLIAQRLQNDAELLQRLDEIQRQ